MDGDQISSTCPTCILLSLDPKDPQQKRTTRVAELLRRNLPPADVELTDFRVVVEKSPDILQDLDRKIVQARETLDHLLHARNRAEAHLADAKSLLHPIRRLPNEILSEIFMQCVPNWYTRSSFDSVLSLDPRMAPWTLTAVSRRWRGITLSLPQLWTYIMFNSEKHRKYTSPRQTVYKTTLFIERSKGYPLSVDITGCNPDSLAADLAFAALAVSIPRWKFLSIALSSLSAFSAGNIFSSLEHLRIFTLYSYLNVNLNLFEAAKAPSLRVLETRMSVSWCRFERLSLPWSQLTTVRDFSTFDEAGLDFLKQASNLADLEVNLVGGPRIPVRGSVTRLPKVLRFIIREHANADASSLENVFKILDMPSLSHLSLYFRPIHLAFFNRQHFFPDLIGGAQRLITLRISCSMSHHWDATSNLLSFLSCTPCVADFQLVDNRLNVEFLAGLTVTSSSPRLPRLRTLDITGCSCFDTSIMMVNTAIYDMLQSRYMRNEGANSSRDTSFAAENAVDLMGASGSGLLPRVEGNHRGLERVRVPRWVYFRKDQRWTDICEAIKVECGTTKNDAD